MNITDISTFDYASLDKPTAEFLLHETEEIKTLMKKTVEGIIETGERLSRVKQRLKHGEFMAWIETEIKCHYSTALHFMRVWQTFGEQKKQISDVGINVSVLYLLSAPSTPEKLRTEIVEMAKAGNPVSFAEAKRLKKIYTDQKDSSSQEKQKKTNPVDAVSNFTLAQFETSELKSAEKQQIVAVIPKAQPKSNFFSLGKHLLYCGSAQSPEFRDRLPTNVSLNIGFPNSSSWSKESLFPVPAKSTLIFHSVFQNDLDLVTLRNIIQKSIELCTSSEEEILFSFLPYPEMLILAENLDCKCFIAEPNSERCQDIQYVWQSLYG